MPEKPPKDRTHEFTRSGYNIHINEHRWGLHDPKYQVNYEHWSRADYWTLDEAVSLLFGKRPELVDWKHLVKYVEDSSFVARYSEIRDLVERALHAGQLSEPLRPNDCIAWAKFKELDYPPELEEQVRAKGGTIEDWKHEFEKLKAKSDEREAEIADQIAAKEAELGTKERATLLKLIIGMAVGGYRYTPGVRSKIPREIHEDLVTLLIPLHVDTVRHWLDEAAKFLPSEALED